MIKLWKHITLLLRDTNHIKKVFFWLLNQLLIFEKINIIIMQIQFPNLLFMLKLPPLQKFSKIVKLKPSTINKLNLKTCLISSNEVTNWLNNTEPTILNYLRLKFRRKFSMDIALHFSHAQICNWVWKQSNILLVNCNPLSHYWNKFLQITSFKKGHRKLFTTEKFSHKYHLKTSCNILWFYTSENSLLLLEKLIWTIKTYSFLIFHNLNCWRLPKESEL